SPEAGNERWDTSTAGRRSPGLVGYFLNEFSWSSGKRPSTSQEEPWRFPGPCHTKSIRRPIKEAIMLNPTSLLADALGRNLAETYRRIYDDREPHIASGLDEAARLVIERIASSDALYHDCEHTALVTLCVQDILRGRRLERTIAPSDWGHTIWAALHHDIGYVRGICAGDTAEHFVIDAAGNTVAPPRGASARRLRRLSDALSRGTGEDFCQGAFRARSLHR